MAPSLRRAERLVVASHNRGKVVEIQRDAGAASASSIGRRADLGLPEPEETGTTFEANAT